MFFLLINERSNAVWSLNLFEKIKCFPVPFLSHNQTMKMVGYWFSKYLNILQWNLKSLFSVAANTVEAYESLANL